MALRSPASWIQGGSHSAENDRLTERAEISAAGVVGSGDLAVSANGTPNMSVNVAAGAAYVKGSVTATQGYYKAYNDATVNLTISASDPSNPRIDLVVLTINDAQYAGAANSAVLQVVTGTPAASPVAPSAPANSYVLAQVSVIAATTSIDNAHITDKRALVFRKEMRFAASSASTSALVVKGSPGQTAALLQIVDSSGAMLSQFDAAGALDAVAVFVNTGYLGARLSATPNNTAEVGIAVRGLAGQTADLQQWQDGSGTVLARVESDGTVLVGGNQIYGASSAASFSAGALFTAASATIRPLLVRGASAQSGNLQEWQDSSGTTLSKVDANGHMLAPAGVFGNESFVPAGPLGVQATVNTQVVLTVRGASSQSGDLQEWQDSAGVVMTSILPGDGSLYLQKGAIRLNALTSDASSNGWLYSYNGALKWRGGSGTITTIAPA